MNAIGYLWRRSLKNRLLQVLKKPLILVMYLLLLAFLLFVLFGIPAEQPQGKQNFSGYAAVLIGVFLFIAATAVVNGMKRGMALFSMADVNLLFKAPVSPRTILLGGIAKQAGTLLLASVFLLFQYPNMQRMAGLDTAALMGLLVAYVLMGISTQAFSALLYAFCAGSEKRRKGVYAALFALILGMAAAFLLQLGKTQDVRGALTAFFGSDGWDYVPLVGWARALAIAFARGQWTTALLYGALLLLSVAAFTLLLQRTDMDYYEDVLLAAERANQAQEDAKAGRFATSQGSVSARAGREMGPMFGRGAAAFTGRILREQARGGVLLLDAYSFGAAAGPLICMVTFDKATLAEAGLWPVFGMTAWMMMFLYMSSGLTRELSYPVLYLAPSSPWRKLMAVLLPQLMKAAVEGVLFAALVMLLFHAGLAEGVIGVLVYVSIAMLYAAAVLAVERILGASRNKALILLVYVGLLLLAVTPGMVGAIMLTDVLTPRLSYLAFAAWNAALAMLIVFLFRNLLHSMDVA